MYNHLPSALANDALLGNVLQTVSLDPVLFFYGATAVTALVLWATGCAFFGNVAHQPARTSRLTATPE